MLMTLRRKEAGMERCSALESDWPCVRFDLGSQYLPIVYMHTNHRRYEWQSWPVLVGFVIYEQAY